MRVLIPHLPGAYSPYEAPLEHSCKTIAMSSLISSAAR